MAKHSGSQTPRWQRVAIWTITIALAGGTIAGFIFMIVATQNPKVDPTTIAQNQQQQQYDQALKQYQEQLAARQKTLRALDGYADKVTSFDATSVTSLQVETLTEGNGATVGDSATISANYTGWTPDGKIFDSTNTTSGNTSASFALNQVITGWAQGLTGKRAGGVYLLTIPADLAYGSSGSSDGSIAPNTPLKFIVQIVDVTN